MPLVMSQETEEIKAKLNLAEFMAGYLKLIPAGVNNFKALCPFHHEKTPSLMVSADKQIWKCFGCGEGGDIFSFLMKMENLEFPEALKILAQKAGVDLRRVSVKIDSQKNRLYDICQLAARYWQKVLMESTQAEKVRVYLKERGLNDETIEDFQLGYAVDSWDNLLNFLGKRGYQGQDIFAAGLAVKKNSGQGFYDRFRGRLMFPIFDLNKKVIGFGGRTLKAEESAKYINTPQTMIYNKSLALYGLVQAKEEIKKQDGAILVEGYMDALPSHQMGVKNVVAISGTALTIEQVKILKRYSSNLLLALDMDAAGQLAAERSIEVALGQEMNCRVIFLPFGKDPGECIKNNPNDWRQAISSSQPIMDYYFSQALKKYRASEPAHKKIIAKILLAKIVKISSRVEQDYWLKKLAEVLGISENILREEVSQIKLPVAAETKIKSAAASVNWEDLIFIRILALVFMFPDFLEKLIDLLAVDFLAKEANQNLYKKIILFYTNNNQLFKDLAVDLLANKPKFDLFNLLNSQAEERGFLPAEKKFFEQAYFLAEREWRSSERMAAETEFLALIKNLKNHYFIAQINFLQSQLKQAEEKKDPVLINQLWLKINDLISQKKN